MDILAAEFIGPTVQKCCPVCSEWKAIEQFQRQASGKYSRHSYCKDCYNEKARQSRVRNYTAEDKARWHRKTRYGLSEADYQRMLDEQNGRCALCDKPVEKFHIDHCHNTGAVRGLLCHQCNIRIGGWDDIEWRQKAMRYLGITTDKGNM